VVFGGGGGAAAGAGGGAAAGEAGGTGLVAERGGAPWPLAPLVEAVVVREPFMRLRSRLELHDKKGRQQSRDRIVLGSETESWCGIVRPSGCGERRRCSLVSLHHVSHRSCWLEPRDFLSRMLPPHIMS
jgi:hypothetical protein